MQFRQQALAKLQSPEELDHPVRLARPQGLLALRVTVVVMAAASVWAGPPSQLFADTGGLDELLRRQPA